MQSRVVRQILLRQASGNAQFMEPVSKLLPAPDERGRRHMTKLGTCTL
jgi:hypothetical protein